MDKVVEIYMEKEVILLDCVTNMVTNIMLENIKIDWDEISKDELNKIENKVIVEIEKLIKAGKIFKGKFIIVSNEVGMGLVPEYPLGRYFRDIAGRVNQIIAKNSDEAYLIVSGIPIKIK